MGIFDKLFKVNESRVRELKFTNEEAFLSLAISSVLADDILSQVEMNVVSHTLSRMRVYRNIHPNQMIGMLNKTLDLLRREGVGTVLNAAKTCLDPRLKETAFALAVDIVLADGVVDAKEKDFLEKLQHAIDISDEQATKIVEVMQIKNRVVEIGGDISSNQYYI